MERSGLAHTYYCTNPVLKIGQERKSEVPKYVKKYQTAQAPPIDWLWAAILERQRVYGMPLTEMAEIAGVTYTSMRNMITKSPWNWRRSARDRLCEYFGISINISPTTDGRVEVNIK